MTAAQGRLNANADMITNALDLVAFTLIMPVIV
jgi:hypothetical protein